MKTAFALLLFCPLAAACWLPPYDEALSDSERFIARVGDPAAAFSVWMKEDEAENGWYLPPRDPASYDDGFWVSASGGSLRVHSVYYDSSTGSRYFAGSWSEIDRFDPYSLAVPDPTNPLKVLIFSNPKQGLVELIRDAGTGSLGNSSMGLYPVPAGIGSRSVSVDTEALFFPEWTALPALTVARYAATALSIAFVDTIVYAYPATLPAPTEPAFFGVDSSGGSYLSAELGDGTTATWRWPAGYEGSDPELLDFVDRRISGMLADGRLYAQGGGRLTLYDPAEASVARLRPGACRLVFERYDSANSYWISVFTRAYRAEASDDDDTVKLVVEVYELPSAELFGLAY